MNLFLYSTNTELSYRLSRDFYNGRFFVWCSPVFEPPQDKLNKYNRIPPSSSPFHIYMDLKKAVESQDLHSDKIKNNKTGLKKGALISFENGVIDEQELVKINYIIDNASIQDFKPILYIIDRKSVEEKLEIVPVHEMANPLSCEYRIAELKESEFETIYQF